MGDLHTVSNAAELVVVVAEELADVTHDLPRARVRVEALHGYYGSAVHQRRDNDTCDFLRRHQMII